MAWGRWSIWVGEDRSTARLWVGRDTSAWRLSHAQRRAAVLRRAHAFVEVREARDEDVADWQKTATANRPRVK